MAVSTANIKELHRIVGELSMRVNFIGASPSEAFPDAGFAVFSFEKPLLACTALLSGLITESFANFSSDVFVKFSGEQALAKSCLLFNGLNIESNVLSIHHKLSSRYDGKFDHPVVMFNGAFDWIALERTPDESGVFAIRKTTGHKGFLEHFASSFNG